VGSLNPLSNFLPLKLPHIHYNCKNAEIHESNIRPNSNGGGDGAVVGGTGSGYGSSGRFLTIYNLQIILSPFSSDTL
jgi:hypothetical protein